MRAAFKERGEEEEEKKEVSQARSKCGVRVSGTRCCRDEAGEIL